MNNLYFSGRIGDIDKYLSLINMLKNGDMLVACDIDNSICNTNESLNDNGYDTSIYPIKNLDDKFWLSKEGNTILYEAKPIKPMFKLLKSLELAGGNITFITQRNPYLNNLTMNWFRKNQIYTSSEIQFVQEKLWINADVYIEDDPKVIEALVKRKKIVLVPTWDYNKNIEGRNIIHLYFENFQNTSHQSINREEAVINV